MLKPLQQSVIHKLDTYALDLDQNEAQGILNQMLQGNREVYNAFKERYPMHSGYAFVNLAKKLNAGFPRGAKIPNLDEMHDFLKGSLEPKRTMEMALYIVSRKKVLEWFEMLAKNIIDIHERNLVLELTEGFAKELGLYFPSLKRKCEYGPQH